MSRKIIVLLVLATLLLSLGVSPMMATADTETFTLGDYDSWIPNPPDVDNAVGKYLAQKTGVSFSKFSIPAGADPVQQLQLQAASNTLPDYLCFDPSAEYLKLIRDNKVIALDKYFADPKNYPNLAKLDKKIVNALRQPDGHVYYLQLQAGVNTKYTSMQNAFWQGAGWEVNALLVKKAGMKLSDLKTMAGFEKYLMKLKTMKDDKGRNYIPLVWDPVSGWYDALRSAFGLSYLKPDARGPKWDVESPNFVKMMTWLSKMNRLGLLDPDALTNNADTYGGKVAEGRYGASLCHVGTMADNGDQTALIAKWGKDKTQYHITEGWQAIPTPVTPGIKVTPYAFISPMGFGARMVSKTCKNPDKLMKLVDYMMSSEAYFVALNGPVGHGLKINTDNSISIDMDYNNKHTDTWNDRVKNDGIWFYTWTMSPLPPLPDTIDGHKYVVVPSISAARRKVAYSTVVKWNEGTMIATPVVNQYTHSDDGAFTKYNSTITDIVNKYRGKAILAGSDAEVKTLYSQMMSELQDRGHLAEVKANCNADYAAFMKTAAGKALASFKLVKKVLDDGSEPIMPEEKGVPGVLYDYKQYVVKQ